MIEPLLVGLIALAAAVAVGLIFLARKIDHVSQRVSEQQRSRTGSAQGAQNILGSRLDALERHADTVDGRMRHLEARVDRQAVMEDRLRHLEARLESQAAQYEPSRPVHDTFLREKSVPAFTAAPPPIPEAQNILAEPQLQDLLREFNELARHYTPASAREFDENWRPLKVREVEAGSFRETEDGNLWLVPLEERHQRWVLLPSGDAVRRWEMHYRAMSGMQARELLKSSYRLQEGSAPIIISPALCSAPDDGHYRLVHQGQMKGL